MTHDQAIKQPTKPGAVTAQRVTQAGIASMSRANFSQATGERGARESVGNRVRELSGYTLQNRTAQGCQQ